MNCPKCQAPIPDKSKFCLECGSNLSGMSGQEGDPPVLQAPDVALTDIRNSVTISSLPTLVASHGREADSASSGMPLASRYEVMEEIGHGGFACVFKARDRRLDRVVAVKRLTGHHAKQVGPSQALQRFIRESQAIASLNHRNIVQVFDTDEDDEGYYIVMEYVGGGTLRDLLKDKQKLPVKDAVTLARGIAQGLAYAHRRNLVHRDIKPSNILLTRDGDELEPKIVDFGLARMGMETELSVTGYGMGTPFYMPPEQRRNAKSVSHTADIYALGKIIYEMVSGEVPDNVLPNRIPQVPGLSALIFKCIESRPEERFFSMDDLIRALDAIPGGRAGQGPVASMTQSGGGLGFCPACGMDNEANAKFCAGCGQGLFRKCPECNQELRVSIRFCSSCGNDVEGFETARTILQRMREYSQGRRWSRVVKEAGLVPGDLRLPGEAGRQMLTEITSLRAGAQAHQEELQQLAGQVDQALKEVRLEDALRLASQYQSLDPGSTDMATRSAQISEQIDERDFEAAQCEARRAIQVRDLSRATVVMEQYIQQHAQGAHTQEAKEWVRRHLPALEGYLEILRLDEDMGKALESQESETAAQLGEKVLRALSEMTEPSRIPELAAEASPGATLSTPAEIQLRVREAVDRLQAMREAARLLDAKAQLLADAGGFEEAVRLLQKAEALYPGDAERNQSIANWEAKAVVQQQKVDLFRQLMGNAQEALIRQCLLACRKVFAQIAPLSRSLLLHESSSSYSAWIQVRDASIELERELKRAEVQFSEAVDRAQAARSAGDYHACMEECAEARKHGQDNPALDKLAAEAKEKHDLLDLHLKAATAQLQEKRWLQAIEQSDAALRFSPKNESARQLNSAARKGLAAAAARNRKMIIACVVSIATILVLVAAGVEIQYRYRCSLFDRLQRDQAGGRAYEIAQLIANRYGPAAQFIQVTEKSQQQKRLAEDKRRTGIAVKAGSDQPATWKIAEDARNAGEKAFGEGRLPDAESAWNRAAVLYGGAALAAGSNKVIAVEAGKALTNARNAALQVAADKLALGEWNKAEERKGRVDALFDRGEYSAAALERAQVAGNYAEAGRIAEGETRMAKAKNEYYGAYSNQVATILQEDGKNLEVLFKNREADIWKTIQETLAKAQTAHETRKWDDGVAAYAKALNLFTNKIGAIRLQAAMEDIKILMGDRNLPEALRRLLLILNLNPSVVSPVRDQAGSEAVFQALNALAHAPSQPNTATNLLSMAAKAGYSPAIFWISHFSADKRYGFSSRQVDSNSVFQLRFEIESLAKAGDVPALFTLAVMAQGSLAGPPNKKIARECYTKAAEAGLTPAMVNLGRLFMDEASLKSAKQYFQQAAAAGDTKAMVNLGQLLLKETGATNVEQALEWFDKAAEAGDPAGLREKGFALNRHSLLADRRNEATPLILKAAQKGDVEAKLAMGLNCKYGLGGVTNDISAAVKWFQEAWELGNGQSAYEIGEICEKGRGVKIDLPNAMAWYALAAKAGYAKAAVALTELKGKPPIGKSGSTQ